MVRTPETRIHKVEPPATLVAGEKARQLATRGKDIIDLSQSSPHHVTPPHIVEAGVKALREGMTNISSSRGLPEFRHAMADLLVEKAAVVVTPGAGFGESGEGHFRIALMRCPADRVMEGAERIARVLENL